MDTQPITGHLILIMAPSGSGKSVLVSHLRQTLPWVYFAVSCTTRNPYPMEQSGETYYFISEEAFDEKIKEGAFFEWVAFGGHRYGTLLSEIVEPLKMGKVVVREVELQGVRAMKKVVSRNHCSVVYIDAGPWEALENRLLARGGQISAEDLAQCKLRYEKESKWRVFADRVIRNTDGHLDETKYALQKYVERILIHIAKK